MDFIDVVAWRNTAEFVSKYFAKGRMMLVDGRLQIRDWLDREGNKRRSAEIVADSVHFCDSRPSQQEQPAYAPAAAYAPVAAGAAGSGYGGDDSAASGDLPF